MKPNSVRRSTKAGFAILLASALAALATPMVAASAREGGDQQTYRVTNGADSGHGTLRAGLESEEDRIVIDRSVSRIEIESTLTYAGSEELVVRGSGQVIQGGDFTLLEIENGADLTMSRISLTGPNGYETNDDPSDDGGIGILVTVPPDRTGTVDVDLRHVVVADVGRHGIHISDCDLPVCGSGQGGAGTGSPASIDLRLRDVTVSNVGNGAFDSDGVRVDERSDGDIRFRAARSIFTGVGADGVELDEGGDGDVSTAVRQSLFENNGGFCDGLPAEEPDPSPLPACYDDGELDLDDGFDIDEADEGSITGYVRTSRIVNNLDEGLDLDEVGGGGFEFRISRVIASGNGDEGFKLSEEGPGDLRAELVRATAASNGADGILLEEAEQGDLRVEIRKTATWGNDPSGLVVTEDGDGDGELTIHRSTIEDGIETNVPTIEH